MRQWISSNIEPFMPVVEKGGGDQLAQRAQRAQRIRQATVAVNQEELSAQAAHAPTAPPMQTVHECLVRKKPSPKNKVPWAHATRALQNRWLVTNGAVVQYFAFPRRGDRKPKGQFDLRYVTKLAPARDSDPSAPEYAIEVQDQRRKVVFAFDERASYQAALRIWTAAAPSSILPRAWATDEKLQAAPQVRAKIMRMSAAQPAASFSTAADD